MFPNPGIYSAWQTWADALVAELQLVENLLTEPLVGKATVTPGTISGGGHTTATVIVPRAEVGMFALASFSIGDPLVKLVGAVIAPNTVNVTFLKLGSGSATLGQGVLRVRVFPLLAGEL
jgi:hypothetical protein